MSRRILLLITDLELGGSPTVVRELAVRLSRSSADVSVEVACLAGWGPVADQLREAGIVVTALNARGVTDLFVLFRLIRLIRRRRYDTVMSFLVHANLVAAAASLRVPGVRWIQSIQTTQPEPAWHWRAQWLASRAAELIVVPSPSVARIAVDRSGVPQTALVVIPNAVDPTDWADAQSEIPMQDPRPYPVTFLGRLDPVKNLPVLLQAIHDLDGLAHLHIYGDGEDRSRVENEIDRLKIAELVTLHGSISSPKTALKNSGLLVLPSLAEGFGLVLIEAAAAGVPVVATDVPGIRDVVRDNETGMLVAAGSAAALAEVIRRLVGDPALRQRLLLAARQSVNDLYSWEEVLPRYRAVLHLVEPLLSTG